RRHTRFSRDWSSDVCSSDLIAFQVVTPTTIDQAVEYRVVIRPIHSMHVDLAGQQARGNVKGVEVHAEQQHAASFCLRLLQVLHAIDGQALAKVDAVVVVTAGHLQQRLARADHAAVRQRFLLFAVELRETQADIGAGDMATLARQVPGKSAEQATAGQQQRPGQLANQPEQAGADPGRQQARVSQARGTVSAFSHDLLDRARAAPRLWPGAEYKVGAKACGSRERYTRTETGGKKADRVASCPAMLHCARFRIGPAEGDFDAEAAISGVRRRTCPGGRGCDAGSLLAWANRSYFPGSAGAGGARDRDRGSPRRCRQRGAEHGRTRCRGDTGRRDRW